MAGSPPNYYAILETSETANAQQIRDAYKRAALKTHPDRVAAESPERAERTRKFQLVNDAYYTLSDPKRRRDYDAQRKLFGGGNKSTSPDADPFADPEEEVPPTGSGPMPGTYSWAWDFFTKNNSGGGGNAGGAEDKQRQDDAQFGDVFEEMMQEEGMADESTGRPTSKFWSLIGGMSGGALGFIVANVPGLVAGAVAGNRLGAVRDAKGKSVWSVFQELPQNDRARILSQLAARIFSHAVGI